MSKFTRSEPVMSFFLSIPAFLLLPPQETTNAITDQLIFQYLKNHRTLIYTPGPPLDCLAVLTRNTKLFLEQKQGSFRCYNLIPNPFTHSLLFWP